MFITLAATVVAALETVRLPVKVVAPVTASVEFIETALVKFAASANSVEFKFVTPVTVRVCVAVTELLNEHPPLEVNAITPVSVVTRIRPTLLTPGLVKSM